MIPKNGIAVNQCETLDILSRCRGLFYFRVFGPAIDRIRLLI
jgi:hypothetical protein